ncbi:MAG: hypothetical protein NTX49_08150 [Chlamydiae bacterium]|nr:hypothetical protein [Chlamydiota bacterium]
MNCLRKLKHSASGIRTQPMDNDENSPPAKRPFPWEKETSANSKELKKKNSAPKPKKTHIKKEDKPLKQLLKIIR